MNTDEKMPDGGVVRSPAGLGPAARVLWALLLAAAAALAGLSIFRGIQERVHAESTLARRTGQRAVPTVQTIQPKRGALAADLVLPGNMQAFTDAPVYARTNGYLRRWYVDIGARVRAGQLLAEIETPEIDQQLRQSRAELATAQANYKLAKSTAERWQDLRKTDSVAQQETDEKLGDLESKGASMEAAGANVKRLEETQAFQKIYAPFDGVVTARNINRGDFVQPAGATTGKPLLTVARADTVRIFVDVSELDSPWVEPGRKGYVSVQALPGMPVEGKVTRTSWVLNANRTLRTELDIPNPAGRLRPGMYATARIVLQESPDAIVVPLSAVVREGAIASCWIIRDGKAARIALVLGLQVGNEAAITSGLKGDEQVVQVPPGSLQEGQALQPQTR